jgi:hypothetical protein
MAVIELIDIGQHLSRKDMRSDQRLQGTAQPSPALGKESCGGVDRHACIS